jgi:hypothetical protein
VPEQGLGGTADVLSGRACQAAADVASPRDLLRSSGSHIDVMPPSYESLRTELDDIVEQYRTHIARREQGRLDARGSESAFASSALPRATSCGGYGWTQKAPYAAEVSDQISSSPRRGRRSCHALYRCGNRGREIPARSPWIYRDRSSAAHGGAFTGVKSVRPTIRGQHPQQTDVMVYQPRRGSVA